MEKYNDLLVYLNTTLKSVLHYTENYIIINAHDFVVIIPTPSQNGQSLIELCKSNSGVWSQIHQKLMIYFMNLYNIEDKHCIDVSILNDVEGVGIDLNHKKICHIKELPYEMLGEIDKYLDIEDAVYLHSTCKNFHGLLDGMWYNNQFKNRYMPIMNLNKLNHQYDYKILVMQIKDIMQKITNKFLITNLVLYDIIKLQRPIYQELLKLLILENCINEFEGHEIQFIIQSDYYSIYEYIINNYIKDFDTYKIYIILYHLIKDNTNNQKYLNLLLDKINIPNALLYDKSSLSDITESNFILICDKMDPYVILNKIKHLNSQNQNILYKRCDEFLDEFTLGMILKKLCKNTNNPNIELIFKICHNPVLESHYQINK